MTNYLLPLVAAFALAASGCSPSETESTAPTTDATAKPAVDAAAPRDPAAEAELAAREADEAHQASAYQDCLRRPPAPASTNTKPPTNAKGMYANKGECRGCSTGWWRANEPTALYATPDFEAAQTATVPAETWVYAAETVSFTVPARGVVVKPGGGFKQCDTVYHLYTHSDEGESWDSVWRQGELLTYDESKDAVIRWVDALPVVDSHGGDGWWVRLQRRNGESGWAWATAREREFSCKWERDPEEVCATAPKKPPPSSPAPRQ